MVAVDSIASLAEKVSVEGFQNGISWLAKQAGSDMSKIAISGTKEATGSMLPKELQANLAALISQVSGVAGKAAPAAEAAGRSL